MPAQMLPLMTIILSVASPTVTPPSRAQAPLVPAHAGQTGAAPAQAQPPATKADLNRNLDARYARLDTDRDGSLSRAELEAAQAAAATRAQGVAQQRLEQEFRKLDSDRNGQLSLAEFKAAAPAPRATGVDQLLQRLDASKDGKVSAAEYKASALAEFDRLDTNRDGTLTAAERQARRQR